MTGYEHGFPAGDVRVGSLCSGAGMLDVAVCDVLGGRVVWHAEVDRDASRVLAARFPGVPNHGDIASVDWSGVERVDVLCGGPPCQPVSTAGRRRGSADERFLWPVAVRAMAELRPALALWENPPGLLTGRQEDDGDAAGDPGGGPVDGPAGDPSWFGAVLGAMAEVGYVGSWLCVRASDVGAPHRRERVFIAAHPANLGRERLREAWDGWSRPEDGAAAAPDPDRVAGGRDGGEVPGAEGGERGGSLGHRPRDGAAVDWGVYEAAVRRWERILGRPAPAPSDDRGRLNPEFVQSMMGWPAGWVTDPALGLSRTAQLRILGNGVVPQQAALAFRLLLERLPVGVAA